MSVEGNESKEEDISYGNEIAPPYPAAKRLVESLTTKPFSPSRFDYPFFKNRSGKEDTRQEKCSSDF